MGPHVRGCAKPKGCKQGWAALRLLASLHSAQTLTLSLAHLLSVLGVE